MATMKYYGENQDFVIGQCTSCFKTIKVKRENAEIGQKGFIIVPEPIKCPCGKTYDGIAERNSNYADPTPKVNAGSQLTTCPACGKQISSMADKCIHCGHPMQTGIICPNCRSKDTFKISAASKVGSAVAFGLFSIGKLNKTYQCNKCGYRW